MEVEDLDSRKVKARSRSNSRSSKDLKSEKSIVKETNGETEEKVSESKNSDLPNGDEPEVPAVESESVNKEVSEDWKDNSDEVPVAEENCGSDVNMHSVDSSSTSGLDSQTDACNSDTKQNEESPEACVEERKERENNVLSDSEDEFLGFDGADDISAQSSDVLSKLIVRYEDEDHCSDEDIGEDEKSHLQAHSSDTYVSATNSPMKIDGVSDAIGVDDICSSNASSPSVASGFSGDGKTRGKKVSVDLNNPAYRKPLEMGWKRELVYRNTADATQKRMADIYYYTPTGKKVRSAREVQEHLYGDELSDEHFTFFKMPLGINDPSKEIIRDAKRGALKEASGTPPQKIQKISKTPKSDMPQKPVVVIKEEPGTTPKPQKNFSRGAFPRIKVTPVRSNQQSPPTRPKPVGRPRKEPIPLAEGELEMGMLPPSWKEPSAVSGARKTTQGTSPSTAVPSKGSQASTWTSSSKEDGLMGLRTSGGDSHFTQFFMQNLSSGYAALRHVFEYLKVHELLRASRVCRMWRDIAGHSSLWRTVRMKNSQVLDWESCAAALSRHGTQHLDLRKMLLSSAKGQTAAWKDFCTAIGRISSLRHLDLCRCPTSVVERVASQCPQLTNLIALLLQDQNLDLKYFEALEDLQELRLKCQNGLRINSSLEVLTKLTNMKHLSLTTIKDLGKSHPEMLQSLTHLETLELGECNDFPESFGTDCLPLLTKLTRLRLEMGQGKCPTFVILSGVRSLPSLTHLELVNFDIKPGFDQALAQCTNIRRLLLIPTYLTQSATTNHMVLGGVTKLSGTLTQFVWGVTHELLHVTELFVDQCEGQKGGTPRAPGGVPGANLQQTFPTSKKSGSGDSIPVLKPVPGRDGPGTGSDTKPEEEEGSKPSPQVDILPLSQLQKLLVSELPNTKISILKIPFHATWRQTLSESSH